MESNRRKRVLVRVVLVLVAGYGGMILMLLALENRLLYHPLRAADDWQSPPTEYAEDVFLRSADGNHIHAWWCPTPTWSPDQGAVLHCHGNAGNLSHRGPGIACWQRELGQAILIFDYPGYGKSSGRPSEAGCYAAADAGYDWLTKEKGVAPERLILFGQSLGGAVAIDLAARRPHRALVIASTFTSVADMARLQFPWLPVHRLVRNRFDSLAKIGRCPGPIFVVHGTADRIIPYSHAQRLFAAAQEPKEFLELPGADHNDPLPCEFHRALASFLKRATALR